MNKENRKWMIEYIATENYDRKNLVIKWSVIKRIN